MFKLIKKALQWVKSLFHTQVPNDEQIALQEGSEAYSKLVNDYVNAPVYLNRKMRRDMAKVLSKHPNHKGMKHTDLPNECTGLEYGYWLNVMDEVK